MAQIARLKENDEEGVLACMDAAKLAGRINELARISADGDPADREVGVPGSRQR